ncbi:methylated-DNA--[protein]-cysteine S-methyltransferase [Azospirillum sp. YIM B02556]|uniref:Methylated-DNA--protein-cysteine methyltransferase n=1 Tax=Azospirillum endophyticum TaxID=2800326 RepID=A0ABS1EZ90_9PROT|nr:methylated-DNA--[protein]-cysteine S-methyltransferase [Azospirillum endophyticum]MBK1836478.1 methylated-DNA--[protein]-cysteine S-methyltransferase [Azospirillum endophyticum]
MARLSIDSPLGSLMLSGDGSALTAVGWGRFDQDEPDAVLAETARQLEAYFTGRLQRFDLPLKPAGTAFRQSVWEAMLAIPYGGTATYGGMAKMLDSGPRAVGGACGANPIPIIIPCHRVLASGGAPGGYSGNGGLDTKAWLLALERRHAGIGEGNGAAAEQFALL